MFVVVRRYAAGARASEVARRVGEGLVPVLTKLPGFRSYYCFVGEDGRPVSVSIVDGRAAGPLRDTRAGSAPAARGVGSFRAPAPPCPRNAPAGRTRPAGRNGPGHA